MKVEVRLPQWGMGINDGLVLRWLKAPGEAIAEGEPLVEIETAKVTGYVEAPVDGVVTEILADPGDVVPISEVLAIIDTDG